MAGPNDLQRQFNPVSVRLATFVIVLTGCVPGCATQSRVSEQSATFSSAVEPLTRHCRVDQFAPLLESAMALAGLTVKDVMIDESELRQSGLSAHGVLDDSFVLPWLKMVRQKPTRLGCFEGDAIVALDAYLQGKHPVADLIRHIAGLLGHSADSPRPTHDDATAGGFETALAILCGKRTVISDGCLVGTGELPEALAEELAPVIWAIVDVAQTVQLWHSSDRHVQPDWWHLNGGNFLNPLTNVPQPDLQNPAARAALLGNGFLPDIYATAGRLALAIENTDFSPFVKTKGVHYDRKTPFGWIRVRDADDDIYQANGTPELLLLDLGGDDLHLDAAGSNALAACRT